MEMKLWRLLRSRKLIGAKFRRQHPFGPYILDFYCPEIRLAVELDGGGHNREDSRIADADRDSCLALRGVRVLRFWNTEVRTNEDGVLLKIRSAVEWTPHPNPLPASRGEGVVGNALSLFVTAK